MFVNYTEWRSFLQDDLIPNIPRYDWANKEIEPKISIVNSTYYQSLATYSIMLGFFIPFLCIIMIVAIVMAPIKLDEKDPPNYWMIFLMRILIIIISITCMVISASSMHPLIMISNSVHVIRLEYAEIALQMLKWIRTQVVSFKATIDNLGKLPLGVAKPITEKANEFMRFFFIEIDDAIKDLNMVPWFGLDLTFVVYSTFCILSIVICLFIIYAAVMRSRKILRRVCFPLFICMLVNYIIAAASLPAVLCIGDACRAPLHTVLEVMKWKGNLTDSKAKTISYFLDCASGSPLQEYGGQICGAFDAVLRYVKTITVFVKYDASAYLNFASDSCKKVLNPDCSFSNNMYNSVTKELCGPVLISTFNFFSFGMSLAILFAIMSLIIIYVRNIVEYIPVKSPYKDVKDVKPKKKKKKIIWPPPQSQIAQGTCPLKANINIPQAIIDERAFLFRTPPCEQHKPDPGETTDATLDSDTTEEFDDSKPCDLACTKPHDTRRIHIGRFR